MGKSITSKYRIEIKANNSAPLVMAWQGNVNNQTLAKYVKVYIDSLKIGGVNAPYLKKFGFYAYSSSCRSDRTANRQNCNILGCAYVHGDLD